MPRTVEAAGPAVGHASAEAIEAWDGPLYDQFVRFRHIIVAGLALHGEEALRLYPPQPGERVLDVGCGFGDTTQRIAGMVGPEGEAVGVDASPRFIEQSRVEADEAGVANASFEVRDVQEDDLGGPYDRGFARMGTMFFVNPVAGLRNIRSALKPGAPFTSVVWRRREDNEWMYKAQTIVEAIVSKPEEYTEPTCGPGPFSMANADTVSDQLKIAGFTDISLHRCDIPILAGNDIEEAIDMVMSIGPAGEILRLQGERAAHLHGKVREELRAGMSEFETPDGLMAAASTWIISATAP